MVSAAPTTPVQPQWVTVPAPRSIRRTLSPYRIGGIDPTTQLSHGRFVRAAHTPDGPGTLALSWTADPAPVDESGLDAEAWGPGADWLLARVDAITGAHDESGRFEPAHPVVERSLRLTRGGRIGASGDLYHQLLPTIIGQRITAGEAFRQWSKLCVELGESAPGPAAVVGRLRLPPHPSTLFRRPAWWFHPLGIETKRARPLTEVARHADKFWHWAELTPSEASRKLALLPGVGEWTIGSVLGPAMGDPDALPVGDFHFKNTISYALADEARGTDERMVELLEPYRGQRGRVLWAINSTVGRAPAFGPRKRILPMAQW